MNTLTHFSAWIERLGIQEELGPLINTVVPWVDASSPAYASAEIRSIVCMDLALCFFYLDDYAHSRAKEKSGPQLQFYDQLEALLETVGANASKKQSSGLLMAYVDLFQKIASFGFSLDRYRDGRKNLIRCYRVRIKMESGETSPGFSDYLHFRMTTIFLDQWFDVWGALGVGNLPPEERALPAYVQVCHEMRVWQVLENELASVNRDSKTGVPNLVTLFSKENAVPLNVALGEVKDMAERAFQSYLKARAELGDLAQRLPMRQAVDLLDLAYEGALKIYRKGNLERYTKLPS